jgi:hypothetical protein
MATHDYVIDNSTGANVRADINNVLAAIVSNNSGSSEPSTTYAYQWWADTNAGVLKIRNSANNAWVTLLELDGTLTLEDGSNSAPAIGFRDDLNTGIFSSGADNLDITCGGTTRANFSSSGLNVTGTVTDDGATHDGDVTFTGASANIVFDKSDNQLEFADNAKAEFGTGGDLEIYHDGTDSYIGEVGTGVLKILSNTFRVNNAANSESMIKALENGQVELYHNNVKKFETTSSGASVTGGITASGASTFNEDVTFTGTNVNIVFDKTADAFEFADNAEARFGSSDDLKFFHNGTNSVIQNNTGTLVLQSDTFNINNSAGNEALINATANGAVELYHNNSKKIETTSGGIDVTGAITVNGSALSAGGKLLQVVSNVYKTDQSFSTQGSYFDTGLTATITPTSSSSHILVFAQLTFQPEGDSAVQFKVLRGSTNLEVGVSGGGTQALIAGTQAGSRGSYPSMQVFDTGISTTSSTTYKVQCQVDSANSRINGRDTDFRACSVMTLMEVSG